MQMHDLIAHPAHPPLGVAAIRAGFARTPHWLVLRWRIEQPAQVIVPRLAGRGRADALWRTTCFELFVAGGGGAYSEFNLSPSERWAAYDFDGYRSGMRARPVGPDPVCSWRWGGAFALFDAAIPLAAFPAPVGRAQLSAVIEEQGGVKSYWALTHATAEKPDFHDPGGFTLPLPAAD